MNSYDVNYKNYYSSRNRSLTNDQRLILKSYKKKISLESFLLSKKIKKYSEKKLPYNIAFVFKMLISLYSGFISSFFSLSSTGL